MKHTDARAWPGYEAASYFCPERRTRPEFPDPPFFSMVEDRLRQLGHGAGRRYVARLGQRRRILPTGGQDIVYQFSAAATARIAPPTRSQSSSRRSSSSRSRHSGRTSARVC